MKVWTISNSIETGKIFCVKCLSKDETKGTATVLNERGEQKTLSDKEWHEKQADALKEAERMKSEKILELHEHIKALKDMQFEMLIVSQNLTKGVK